MTASVFRVHAFNASSVIAIAVVFGLLVGAIAIWRVGTPRFIALAVVAVVLGFIVLHMYAAKVRLDDAQLRIGAGVYRIAVVWEDVVGVSCDLEQTRLRWRTNGIGLPGFTLGWCTDAQRRRVFAACGRSQDAVRLHLRGSYDVVVGVAEREVFLQALARRIPASPT